jgi:hypothetical protein
MISSLAVASGVKTGACPPEQIWSSVATGLLADREAAPWIAHAAECGFCGSLLREATEDLAMDATPEELQQVREFVTPEWRGKMARAMSAAASGVPFKVPFHAPFKAVPSPDQSAATQPAGGWLDWLRRRIR